MPSSRRSLLTAFLSLPLIDVARMEAFAQAAPELPLTLACDDEDELTLEREAGPFFRPNSLLNRDLYAAPGCPKQRSGPARNSRSISGFEPNSSCGAWLIPPSARTIAKASAGLKSEAQSGRNVLPDPASNRWSFPVRGATVTTCPGSKSWRSENTATSSPGP